MKIKMKEQGFSLVVVLVFIAMLSSLAIIAVRMGGLTASSMYGEKRGKEAYYIAEAAYQYALFKLNQDPSWRGDLTDQPFGSGMYSVNVSQASQANPVDDITITAVGSVGDTVQTIVRVIPPPSKPFKIFPFAGTGTGGFSGDNGPAVSADLNRPRGISKNAAGDVYIADTNNDLIRYVDSATKNIYSFAGGGGGYCDDCPSQSTSLNKPEGVYIDMAGNVYIADTSNHIIRKVISGGNIITIAGTQGSGGYSGDGNSATGAKLKKPRDIVLDNNSNIYIADTDNCRIRKVDTAGFITTFAGTGTCGWADGQVASAQFDKPRGLAFDATGNLYIADTNNHRIRKIDMGTQIVTTIAGDGSGTYGGDGGLAVNAQINKPEGVAVNQFGTIYIADTNNNRIRKIDPTNGYITTFAGTGTPGDSGDGGLATGAQINKPSRLIVFDDVDGHLIISDTNNNRIREVTNVY